MRVGFRRSVVSVLRHLLADVSSTWICEFDQVVSSNGLRLVKCYGVEMDGRVQDGVMLHINLILTGCGVFG